MKSNVHEGKKKEKIANFKDLVMGSELAITTADRDVGAGIDSTVNMPAWCSVVVKKAARMLRTTRKEIENETKTHYYVRILITLFSLAPLISEYKLS